MNAKTFWRIGGALGFVLILALGWFLLVSPMFATIGTNDRMRADVEARNASLQAAIAAMSDVDVPALAAELEGLSRALPGAVDEAGIIRELLDASSRSGATLAGATFQTPSYFAPVAGPDGAPLPIDPADLQAAADAGLLVLQVTVQLNADADHVLAFADALQDSGRRFLVQSVNLPAADDGSPVGSVDAIAFIMPALAVPIPG